MQLPNLNLPNYNFDLKRKDNKLYIKGIIRNRLLLLTPEEWVRQNFIAYLISEKNMPKNLIAVEKQILVNGLTKRFDILVYDLTGCPQILIECKAHSVPLSQEVFNQVSAYNLALKVPYLFITNGVKHFASMVDLETRQVEFLKEIPNYDELSHIK